ncbi:MAG: amino acid ABC transporter permease [Clostridia bacterium]|nr:amino acid ABC transporter permease [Clostridia bacterium]MBQ3463066.1 amino acid ABC transporter permease [Clostridia bacterium]MBQ3470830.1 amino acid ABC transporter permease [Clostridia bacterium]MBQ6529719.1 amino acid ABC transporter permease [Clostridia bacterium]MBQ6558939.1 amino acid ABC transporter permease [Clostridia bacterium]
MDYIISIMPQLLEGLKITLYLFAVTLVLSLPLGLLIALLNEAVQKKLTDNLFVKIIKLPIRVIIYLYLLIFRGTPLMLQLFFFYFGSAMIKLPNGDTMALSAFMASAIAFVLNYSAYFAEIFRGGIIGVNNGQYEASKALGLTGIQTMRYVVVPQMLRTVIPPIANETIVLVKDTALASSIALIDLMRASQRAVNRDMKISPLLVAALFYLAITLILTFIFNRVEKRLSISEQGVK